MAKSKRGGGNPARPRPVRSVLPAASTPRKVAEVIPETPAAAPARPAGTVDVLAPRAFRRLGEDGRLAVGRLQDVAARRAELTAELERTVLAARAAGVSWDLIGWSIGTTGRAASMRWSGAGSLANAE